ncbi:hypothetical protein PAECIP111893_02653 [Paenibacillus plantiphilus]|uniref:Lipoprotein n=1 Tax=Paenibacillus plantiphilus TaxID=2905650 RepID=A0ABN8GI69_9BACL|nr:hypothetical protein [Paenibacillus plantiphilus]CAH1206931.1 hypothetical protein PAECIP111893_02653 [Paenibacillus plantiphilus]
MRRSYIVFCILFFLAGCSTADVNTHQIEQPDTAAANLDKVIADPPVQEAAPDAAAGTDGSLTARDENIAYINRKLSFTLEFPAAWREYYNIYERENGIDIYFIGQSQTSKYVDEEQPSVQGLYFFSIATEASIEEDREFLDGVTEIGGVNGTAFVAYSATDCSICILVEEETDTVEHARMQSDWEQASRMSEEKEHVLQSFRAYSVEEDE